MSIYSYNWTESLNVNKEGKPNSNLILGSKCCDPCLDYYLHTTWDTMLPLLFLRMCIFYFLFYYKNTWNFSF